MGNDRMIDLGPEQKVGDAKMVRVDRFHIEYMPIDEMILLLEINVLRRGEVGKEWFEILVEQRNPAEIVHMDGQPFLERSVKAYELMLYLFSFLFQNSTLSVEKMVFFKGIENGTAHGKEYKSGKQIDRQKSKRLLLSLRYKAVSYIFDRFDTLFPQAGTRCLDVGTQRTGTRLFIVVPQGRIDLVIIHQLVGMLEQQGKQFRLLVLQRDRVALPGEMELFGVIGQSASKIDMVIPAAVALSQLGFHPDKEFFQGKRFF